MGDPACDLVVAWTFLDGPARQAFVRAVPVQPSAWVRARGWALWKALLTLADGPAGAAAARRYGWRCGPQELVDDFVADHRSAS